MRISDSTKLNVSISVAVAALLGVIAGVWNTSKAWSGKADKAEVQTKADKAEVASLALTVSTLADKATVDSLAKTIPTLADKKDVESLRGELNELSLNRREVTVMLKFIREMVEKTDSRMVKFEDNQKWQIQQEVQRLQWQSFKPETPPPANVKQ